MTVGSKRYCDRCKGEEKAVGLFAVWMEDRGYELCPGCYEPVKAWLGGAEGIYLRGQAISKGWFRDRHFMLGRLLGRG